MWIGDVADLRLKQMEPDLVEVGPMTLTIITRKTARSPEKIFGPFPFDENTEKLDLLHVQGAQMRLRFESNVEGGDYQEGQTLLYYEQGDVRR